MEKPKKLIVVESTAKTKTIKGFVGKEFLVEASVGHIRDLPKDKFGINEKTLTPSYVILPEKKEVVKKLKETAKNVEEIYLAPDPDREGEAIAWHIKFILSKVKEKSKIKRIVFNEITRNAVLKALKQPRDIDINKVNAQQARRLLDRILGFKLSPLLWKKVKQGLSAGRVQSVALKMVCDREEEINSFKPQEYWVVEAEFTSKEGVSIKAKLEKQNREEAEQVKKELVGQKGIVEEVKRKESKLSPPPPFITSTLQQEANKKFGFSAKKTMLIAQELYEGVRIGSEVVGVITYMRTDSVRIADEALKSAREFIKENIGREYLPKKANKFKNRSSAQDAHEAIRPTNIALTPDTMAKHLNKDQLKIYSLIWKRFVASQMKPAIYNNLEIKIAVDNYSFIAKFKRLVFPGFLHIYREENAERDNFPPINKAGPLLVKSIETIQKFTKPPSRFSDATLVKALEEKGIGRPSTYATILSTLTDREYCVKEKGKFVPTKLGMIVNELLKQGFSSIINEKYTSYLEEQLDYIERGEKNWKEVLKEFAQKFEEDLKKAETELPNLKKEGIELNETCPKCGSNLKIRFGRYGPFIGCSSYPKCSFTKDLSTDNQEEAAQICPKCGELMELKKGRFGFYLKCDKCNLTSSLTKKTGMQCPNCKKGEVIERKTKKGKLFFGCSEYPKCSFTSWQKPVNKSCPLCQNSYLIEVNKGKTTILSCPNKECNYRETQLNN